MVMDGNPPLEFQQQMGELIFDMVRKTTIDDQEAILLMQDIAKFESEESTYALIDSMDKNSISCLLARLVYHNPGTLNRFIELNSKNTQQ